MFSHTENIAQEKTLIHFHIPKTAGTTLDSILRRNFPESAVVFLNVTINPQCVDEFKHLPEKRRREIRYLGGHMPFGLHEHLPHSSTYITLLRDPIDRVISEYYYVLETPGNVGHDEVTSKGISLQDYVCNGVLPFAPNAQTRLISGVLWRDLLTDSAPPTSNIVEIAKKNLGEHFLLVGLTGRFDESLILLKRNLGWRNQDILYVKHKVGRIRPTKDDIANDTLKIIEKYNELDMELYEFAKHNFEKLILEQGFSFKRELQTFRLYNKLYGSKFYSKVSLLPRIGRVKTTVRNYFG